MAKLSSGNILQLDIETARAVALRAQGLDRPAPFGKGKEGALQAIRHLGYIQLDTLAVVVRAHHHTLWTRAAGYEEKYLGELLKEKRVFEYWSHAAAYLPFEDFRFSLPRKNEFRKGRSHWFAKDKKVMKYVLDRIRAEGALQAKDFETDRPRGSWFDWKPAKIALEQLFQDGSLMVTERRGFQKVYDLAERVIPPGTDTSMPTTEEYAAHLVRGTLRAHGVASPKDMLHLRRGMQQPVGAVLKKMVKAGEVIPVKIGALKDDHYMLHDLELPKMNSRKKAFTAILSPFDNAVIRRQRLNQLFNYDYTIECYLPEPKRTFGYFCLPVLHNGKFIGRFDPKADRATKTFFVKQLYIESVPDDMDVFLVPFAATLKAFAGFNGCDKIVLGKVKAAGVKKALTALLK